MLQLLHRAFAKGLDPAEHKTNAGVIFESSRDVPIMAVRHDVVVIKEMYEAPSCDGQGQFRTTLGIPPVGAGFLKYERAALEILNGFSGRAVGTVINNQDFQRDSFLAKYRADCFH